MAKFKIYSKDGQSVRYEGCPRYNGVYLKVSYLEFASISSPVPIDWHVGDYIDYPRTGLRYTLRSVPAIRKTAKTRQTGDAFTYPNVQFMAQTQDLVVAPFRDLVPGDNGIHFSTQQSVSTYENAYGIAARIQACLDDMFPGVWSVEIYEDLDTDFKEKISEAVDFSISGASCLEACDRMYETWGIGWTHYKDSSSGKDILLFGRPNTRDSDNTTSDFVFGPGQGLTAIKRSTANTDELGTRLYVYGSTKNMLPDYYKGLNIYMGESVDIQNLMIPLSKWGATDGKPDAKKAFLEASPDVVEEIGLIPKTHYFDGSDGEEIHPTLVGMTIGDVKSGSPDYYPDATAWPDNSERVDEIEDAHNPQDDGYSGSSDGSKYKATEIYSFGGFNAQPINLLANMRPGKKQEPYRATLISGINLSSSGGDQVTLEPGFEGYIDDANGVIMSLSVTFKLSAGDALATSTCEASKDGNLFRFKLDTISLVATDLSNVNLGVEISIETGTLVSTTQCYLTMNAYAFTLGASSSLSSDFILTLKQIGFNIANRTSLTTEGLARIFMKDGMNAGRSFYVRTCEYVEDGDKWMLGMYRTEDESTGMRYPNSTFPINPGDHFVLLDISMPELYIDAAMQRLYDKGMEMLNDISRLKPFYEPEVDAKVMVEQERVLREGMYMRLTDADIAGDTSEYVLIDTLTVNEGDDAIPTYKVGLREYKKRSFQESTNSAINDLGNKVSGGSIESKPTTGGQTLNYRDLTGKPSIDNVALVGNMASYDDLGLINKTFFELVNIGTEETPIWAIKAKYGLFSEQFISVRDADPEAGGGGMDIDAMWAALAAATGEKINASHIPGLSSLSGKLGNSQLENSAMTIAGKTVSLGESITASEIAEAIGKASPSALGLVKTGYVSSKNNYAVKLDSEGRMFVNIDVKDYFGIDADGNVFVKDNRGFYSNSFISARGADPEAGGGGGVDMASVWAALAADTSEQINASHIPALSISKITGLQNALDSKLSAITRDMVESVLTGTVTSHNHDGMYAPLSGGVIPSQYLPSYVDDVLEYASKSSFPASGEAGKIYVALDTNLTYRWGGSSYVEISPSLALGYTSSTAYPGNEGAANASAIATLQGYFTGGAANKVAHALTISYDGGTAVKFDGSSALSVTIPSDEQRALWDKICALFDIDADGNVFVTGTRGFYSNSFLSARGADPEASGGGTGGLDIDAMWDALATSGTQKIDASHIPALGLLAGTVSNAQLANSSITIAGVEVPLGSAVTTAQIASALTAAGYKLTDTVTTLASMGITATAAELNRLDGITASTAELNCLDGISGPIQKQIDAKADASALAGYLPLTGGTLTGKLNLTYGQAGSSMLDITNTAGGEVYFRMYSGSTYVGAFTANQASYGTAIYNPMADSDKRYLGITNDGVPHFQGNPLLHSGNYTSYTVTKSGGGASGTWPISISGDAATLGGYGPGTLTRTIDYYWSGVLTAVGWYRVFTAEFSNARGMTVMLYLWRSYSQTNNEAYIFNISIAYNGRISITQTSGGYNARLIDKLRVVWVNSGACYIDFHIGISSQGNRYYVSGKGVGTFQAPAAVSETVTGNVTEFSTVNGVASNYGFTGDLSGTASNASMLDGWFSAVNTWYPSSTISLNDYTSRNALSSVGWDFSRSKYVAGGPYGDYFSCAATVLTLPGTYPPQLYSDYNGDRYFLRTYYASTGWSTWKEIVTSSRIGSMKAGDTTAFSGYGLVSFDVTTDLGKCTDFGCYVIGLMQITDYTTVGNHADGRLIFIRQNGNNAPQQIVYSLGTRYNTTNVRFGFLRMSTHGEVHPCTFTYNGKKWAGFVVRNASSYSSGVYCSRYAMRSGERSTPFMVKYYTSNTSTVNNAEINNSLLINGSDIELDGVSTNYFAGDLSGNASSATKLATARSLWGQLFNGEHNVSGDMSAVGNISMSGGINSRVYVGSGDDLAKIGFAAHNAEFKGHGYLHMSYYFRPGYASNGASKASVFVQNASASNSPTFTTTHAFYNNGNAYHLGDVGIGTTSPSAKLHVVGTGYFSSKLDVAGTIHSSTGIWSDGYVSAHGVDTTSDKKFKDGITQLDKGSALDVIRSLKPSTWTWNALSKVKGRSAGFVAQEVENILPDAIRKTGGDRHLALNYQMLHAYEVAALQEHDGEIQRLRRRVAELENKIKDTWHTGQTS